METTKTDFILDDLCSRIYGGAYPEGKLPTQRELSGEYGCSRFTIQKVLKQLEFLGILVQVQGSGIYINDGLKEKPAVYNSLMKTPYEDVHSRMLSLTKSPAGRKLAQIFCIKPGDDVWEFRRIRMVLGEFSEYEVTWMPCEPYPDLSRSVIEDSIQGYVLSRGIPISHMMKNYRAVSLTGEEAALLSVKRGTPAMEIITRGVLAGGKVFEYSRVVSPGYHCMYLVPFDRGNYEIRRWRKKT